MGRYAYSIQQRTIHSIDCYIGRLWDKVDKKVVCDTTALSREGAYTVLYRHWVRLTELDEIGSAA